MSAARQVLTVGLLLGLFGGTAVYGQRGTVVGSVRTPVPGGETVAIPGVRMTLTCGSEAARGNQSDEQGEFQFAEVPVGSCVLVTDVQGFKSVSTAFENTGTERIDLPLSLELEAMSAGLMVIGTSLDTSVRAASSKTRSHPRACRRNAATR